MNKTIEALKKSIKHWEDMRDEKESRSHNSTKYCALCQLFYIEGSCDCTGCPIKATTGRNLCVGTPYGRAVTTENAQGMVDFLKDALIKKLETWVITEESKLKEEPKEELVEKWVDITPKITWKAWNFSNGYWLIGSYKNDVNFICFCANGLKFNDPWYKTHYQIRTQGITDINTEFTVMKKEMVSK